MTAGRYEKHRDLLAEQEGTVVSERTAHSGFCPSWVFILIIISTNSTADWIVRAGWWLNSSWRCLNKLANTCSSKAGEKEL